MTLISRNKITLGFGIFCGAVILLFLGLFLFNFYNGKITPLPDHFSFQNFSLKSFLFDNYSVFSVISIVYLGIFSFTTTIVIRYSFEKTQSPEIIFFIGFLISCLFEYFRLLIPLYNLWESYSRLLIFIGKGCFACRLISLFCFLFSALFSDDIQSQTTEKTLLIIAIVSWIFVEFLPINTGTVNQSINPASGFSQIFEVIQFVIFFLTCISMIFYSKSRYTLSYVYLIIGYFSLVYATNFFLCFIGIILLSFGTFKYLQKIHNYYLWQ